MSTCSTILSYFYRNIQHFAFIHIAFIYDIAEQARLIDNYLIAVFILEDSRCSKSYS